MGSTQSTWGISVIYFLWKTEREEIEMSFARRSKPLSDTIDISHTLKKKEEKKEKKEEPEDSEDSDESNAASRSTQRVSMREITNLDLLSYRLCIRTSAIRNRTTVLPENFTKPDFTREETYYILPLGGTA